MRRRAGVGFASKRGAAREEKTPEQIEADHARAATARAGVKRWSPGEAREHLIFVESLLAQPQLTERQRQVACFKKFGFGLGRLRDLSVRVRSSWEKEDAHLRMQRKAEQTRRIYRHLAGAQGQRNDDGTWKVKPNWSAVAKFEDLLADLHGTREPLKIDIDVRASEAVMLVIAQMTPAQVQARLERYGQRVAIAERVEREERATNVPGTSVILARHH